MSRLEDLDAVSRERSLTEAEVDRLYYALEYERHRDRINRRRREIKRSRSEREKQRRRERYETDQEYRARTLANWRAAYHRRKLRCSQPA